MEVHLPSNDQLNARHYSRTAIAMVVQIALNGSKIDQKTNPVTGIAGQRCSLFYSMSNNTEQIVTRPT